MKGLRVLHFYDVFSHLRLISVRLNLFSCLRNESRLLVDELRVELFSLEIDLLLTDIDILAKLWLWLKEITDIFLICIFQRFGSLVLYDVPDSSHPFGKFYVRLIADRCRGI